jgi:Trypsin-like peptidase domain
VSPQKSTWKATTAKHLLEFSSVPGTFEVTLLVISQGPDGLSVDEASVTIEVEGCGGKLPPAPDKPAPKDGMHDPLAAIARVQFGTAGCTAAAIHPRRPDGRWDVLCAAHCVSKVGEQGTMTLKDGRRIGVRVAALDKTGDCAWFVTDESVDDMPYAKLAAKNPAVGVKVWHAGFGVDKPTNREDGEVQDAENRSGQSRFLLSVSSGDSGGPILRDDTNEVVASCCCTLERGAKVSMWGTSAENAARRRPKTTAADANTWAPKLMPVIQEGLERNKKKAAEEWTPADLPIRDTKTGRRDDDRPSVADSPDGLGPAVREAVSRVIPPQVRGVSTDGTQAWGDATPTPIPQVMPARVVVRQVVVNGQPVRNVVRVAVNAARAVVGR